MTRHLAVVDASIAVKWLVPEEDSDLALRLAHSWAAEGVQRVAHRWFPIEVASALYKRVQRGALSVTNAAFLVADLADYGIVLYDRTSLHLQALHIAHRLQQKWVYDSYYLALAIEIDCPMWTADRVFYDAAHPTYPRVHPITEI